MLFAILQKYDFSSKSQLPALIAAGASSCLRYCKSTIFQANHNMALTGWKALKVVCDTAKVRFFKQITTFLLSFIPPLMLFAILQKYDFSSKSQLKGIGIFSYKVVCDTAKVRFFKQITTFCSWSETAEGLFAILQKYDFSSKSQLATLVYLKCWGCLRYCKSTIFQANHNRHG